MHSWCFKTRIYKQRVSNIIPPHHLVFVSLSTQSQGAPPKLNLSNRSLSLSLPPYTIIKTTRTSRKIVNIQNYSIFSLQDVLSKKTI